MGNNISSEGEGSSSSSSSENSPPAKQWTALRGRAEGFDLRSHAGSSTHQLPISISKQEPVEAYFGPQLGSRLTAWANKENTKPTSHYPKTPNPKRRKTHVGLARDSGATQRRPISVGPGLQNSAALPSATTNEGRAPVTPRRREASRISATEIISISDSSESNDDLVQYFQNEKTGSDEDSFPDLEQLISRSAASISRSGGKRDGLACMNCLRRMGSSRCRKPFYGCRNQPGRGGNAPCQLCREGAQGCRQREYSPYQLYRGSFMADMNERANSSLFRNSSCRS
jgi:hypothetical protein